MFQIDIHSNHDADARIDELATAIGRYAELRGERSSGVITALTGMVERLVVFEELRGRFDVRAAKRS